MKNVGKWIFGNGLFFIAVWYGFVEANVFAYWTTVVITWFVFLVSMVMLHPKAIDELVKQKFKTSVPPVFDLLFDTAIAIVMFRYEAWFIGSLYILHIAFIYEGRQKLKVAYAKAQNEPHPNVTI